MGNAEYMGTVFPRQSDNMKFFAVLALAAVAFTEPEADAKADPAVLYGAYGYGLPYASVYGGYRTYGAYPYTYGGAYYGKRSADAEPEAAADAEADPALLYGAYGYGLPYSSVYRSYGAYPYGYRTYGAYPYGYYGKRSADAEPEADPALHHLQRCVSPDHCLHPRCRSPDHCLHCPPGRLHSLSRRPCCQDCRPPGRHLPRPRRVHCPQGPSPRCRRYLCWTRPLFPRWSLPQQCRCPGPLLNSTTSTSPNNNENKLLIPKNIF